MLWMGMGYEKSLFHHIIREIFHLPMHQQPRIWNFSSRKSVMVHISHEAARHLVVHRGRTPPPMRNSVQVPKVIFEWAPSANDRFTSKVNFRLIAHSWTPEVSWMTMISSTTTTKTVVCPSLIDHVRCVSASMVFSFVLLTLRLHEPLPSFIPAKEAKEEEKTTFCNSNLT
jgi:hypothetical protein